VHQPAAAPQPLFGLNSSITLRAMQVKENHFQD
jgi:hypothetical protein